MGGAQSLLEENDWDLADGGLLTKDQTIDGAEPTSSYKTYNLIKKVVLANQREFDVTDSKSNLLYHVKPSPGTIAGFDILGVGSANSDEYVLRITVDISRRYWIVYRFNEPVFEGQKADAVASDKFAAEHQGSMAKTRVRATAVGEEDVDASVDPQISLDAGVTPQLYKVCSITVSWSRYMAVAALFGPPTEGQLLHAEAQRQQQKMEQQDAASVSLSVASALWLKGKPSDAQMGEELSQKYAENSLPGTPKIAASYAAFLRSRPLVDDLTGESESSVALVDSDEDIEANGGASSDSPATSPVEELALASEIIFEENYDEVRKCNDESRDGAPSLECQPSLADDLQDETETTDSDDEPIELRSLADNLQDETETAHGVDSILEYCENTDAYSDEHVGNIIIETLSQQDMTHEAEKSPAIQASASMPELTRSSKKHNSRATLFGSTRSWLKEKSDSFQKGPPSVISSNSIGGVANCVQSRGASSVYSSLLGKQTTMQDPEEGVVDLDKPIFLCQEIYTRIIGNHQTSRVSKQRVLELLRQDMEQHVRDEGTSDANVFEEELEAAGVEVVNGIGPILADLEAAPSCGPSVQPSNYDEAMKGEVNVDETGGESKDGVQQKEQPLVGYFVWENTLRVHKLKMYLAKGSDLALHVVLAVLVNQVRYERNAIAMTV